MTGPSRLESLAQYREHARSYDSSFSVVSVRPVYRRALSRLAPRQGETIVDVACGTGLNLPALCHAVGPSGKVIGVEPSQDMLAIARARLAERGCVNVELVERPAEDAELPEAVDAALFSFAHDVLRNPAAIARVAAALRPGGRAIAAGSMDPWLPPLRPLLRRASRPYVTTLDGLEEPWSHLGACLEVEHVERPAAYLGSMYVVSARRAR